MKTVKLSPRQMEVLKWLAGGWQLWLDSEGSSAVQINRWRVCNVDTMAVLVRLGFAYETGRWSWRVTDAGKAFYEEHKEGQ